MSSLTLICPGRASSGSCARCRRACCACGSGRTCARRPAPRGPSRAPTSGGARVVMAARGARGGGGGTGRWRADGASGATTGERRDDAARRATTRRATRDDAVAAARTRRGTRAQERSGCVSRTRAGAHHQTSALIQVHATSYRTRGRSFECSRLPPALSGGSPRGVGLLRNPSPARPPRALPRHSLPRGVAPRPCALAPRAPLAFSPTHPAPRGATRVDPALPRDASPAPRALLPAPPRPSCPPASALARTRRPPPRPRAIPTSWRRDRAARASRGSRGACTSAITRSSPRRAASGAGECRRARRRPPQNAHPSLRGLTTMPRNPSFSPLADFRAGRMGCTAARTSPPRR